MARLRRVGAVVLAFALFVAFALPADATAQVDNHLRATVSVNSPGPEIHDYRDATPETFDTLARWNSGTYEHTTASGSPTAVRLTMDTTRAWADPARPHRRCASAPSTSVPTSITLDTASEVTAGRMRSDGGDIRVLTDGGTAVPHHLEGPTPSAASVLWIRTTSAFCVYWGAPATTSASNSTATFANAGTGTMSGARWTGLDANNANSVDWSLTPSSTATNAASTYTAACTACGMQLQGWLVPSTTGSYTLYASGDDGFYLDLSTSSSTAGYQRIVTYPSFVSGAPTNFTESPDQASAPISLVAGQRYAIRARARNGGSAGAIGIGWRPPGSSTITAIPTSNLATTSTGATGALNLALWTGLATTLLSSVDWTQPPTTTFTPALGETPLNVADLYGSELVGFFTAPITGTYRWWIASDDQGALWLSTNSSPANYVQVASMPTWTSYRNWTANAAQQSAPIDMVAGRQYAVRGRVREGAGGDHLSIAVTYPGQSTQLVLPASMISTNLWTAGSATLGSLESKEGTWTTPTVDSGAGFPIYGLIAWTASVPSGTSLTFQVATATSSSGPWNFLGPDGTAGTSFGVSGEPVPFSHDGRRYARIRAYFSSPGGATPALSQLTLGTALAPLAAVAGTPTVLQFPVTNNVARDEWLLRIRSDDPGFTTFTTRLRSTGMTTPSGLTSVTGRLASAQQFAGTSGGLSQTTGTAQSLLQGGGLNMGLAATRSAAGATGVAVTIRYEIGDARLERDLVINVTS